MEEVEEEEDSLSEEMNMGDLGGQEVEDYVDEEEWDAT